MLLALRTAQAGYIRRETGLNPILLLDDIFDKLDNERMRNLVELVDEDGQFGQVFITDVDSQRMKEALKDIRKEVRMFTVENGTVQAQENE
jgi:DNA replication and repair protein RecF